MKIGIDTFACGSGSSAVGVYLRQLLKRIPPSGLNYELFGWLYDRFAYTDDAPGAEFLARCRITGNFANTLWHIVRYPEFAASRNWEACFFPAAHRQLPRRSPCPAIGVVHDMAAFWGGHRTREHLGMTLRLLLPNAFRRLDRVIAVSAWVKQELMEKAGVREELIEVVPNGIDLDSFYPRPRDDKETLLIQPFSFRRPYILYAERLEDPIKNHIRLIEAFGKFKEKTKYPHRLVLAGGDSRRAKRIHEAVARSPWRNDIFFTGFFPDTSLPELYAGADFVVIPSMYEGFGMGVLEAMASGVPVCCARAASLPETAEQAALYFDPLSAEDMADCMVRIAQDHELRNACIAQGIERAQAYSWDACAERTLSIIRETIS
jgi:glycosyltransferase involved in cell wall biosynthesis